MKPALNEILTKDEVAFLLDCEPSTIEDKARKRELPGLKIGRSWIFPREALLKRLNEIALEPAPPSPTPLALLREAGRRNGPPVLPRL